MTLLRVTIFACFPFVTLGWMSCPQSIPTVSIVSRCPSNAKEWMMASEKKDCGAMQTYQNCSNDGSFVYHCVLNEDATMLLEVCAPIWYMSGYCARFSIANKRLVNNPGLDCTKSASPCPARFPSNESFKYQMCYHNVTSLIPTGGPNESPQALLDEQEQFSSPVIIGFLVLFVLTSICLLILLIFGKKIKGLLPCGAADTHEELPKSQDIIVPLLETPEVPLKDNGEDADKKSSSQGEDPAETQEDTLQQNLMNEDAESMEITTMSGKKHMISLKDVKNVGDLLHNLSEKLEIEKEHLWIVNKENGVLFHEDIAIDPEKSTSYTLVTGNKMRGNGLNEDGNGDKNFKQSTTIFRMKCGHGTDAETLLKMIRDMLPGTEYVELNCPLCKANWEKGELVKQFRMSEDEERFLDCVLRANRKTKREFQ